jgi:hypothetical protein
MSYQNTRYSNNSSQGKFRNPYENNNINSINPLEMESLKSLNVEKLEEDIAKEIKKKKNLEDKSVAEMKRICEESSEIRELKNRIKMASLNQERTKQIYDKQTKKLSEIYNDAETDEQLLKRVEEEKRKEQEKEFKKRSEMINSKQV